MRIRLSETSREKLFFHLKQSGSFGVLAESLGVTQRTLKEWEKGNNTIPELSFHKLVNITNSKIGNYEFEILEENWNTQATAKKGGLARIALYGNPGTKEGRIKGGFESIKTHSKLKSGFLLKKEITLPKHSETLSEMFGILVGDGHVGGYQSTMTTSSVTDREHALFVSHLFTRLFGVVAPVQKNSGSNSVDVVVSSRRLVEFFESNDITIGNKIHNGLHVPKWIMDNEKYWRAFIRGLFDTDGCVYLDRHKRREKTYKHIGWTISSNADKLVKDIIYMLDKLGFSPTYTMGQHSVYLRKQEEVRRYFSEIGTSNPKHLARYQKFNGEVA